MGLDLRRREARVSRRPGGAQRPEDDRDTPDAQKYEVLTGKQLADEQASNVKDRLGFLNTFLLVFAFIALFVGSFIIYNTFSIIVAQRSRELALLRALGASGQAGHEIGGRGGIRRRTPLVGARARARCARRDRAPEPAGGVRLRAARRKRRSSSPERSSSHWWPARSSRSSRRCHRRAAPRECRRSPRCATPWSSPRAALGATGSVGLLAVIGILLAALGLFGDVSSDDVPGGAAGVVGVAAFLVFIGVAMLSPLVARPVSQFLGWVPARLRGTSGVLARENAMRNPAPHRHHRVGADDRARARHAGVDHRRVGEAVVQRRSSTTACAPTSWCRARGSSAEASRRRSPTRSSRSSRARRSSQFRQGEFVVDGDQQMLFGVNPNVEDAIDIKLRTLGRPRRVRRERRAGEQGHRERARAGSSATRSRCSSRRPGCRREKIQGIYDEDRSIGASYLLSLKSYEENYVDQADALVAVRKAPDASTEETRATIERVLKPYPTVEVQDQTEFKDSQIAQFNTILNLLYVMLLLAVVIALIGIVNTLALSIYERTRELGLLRAVGMTRAQVRTMVRDEAVIISIFGSLLGLAIGLAFGRAFVERGLRRRHRVRPARDPARDLRDPRRDRGLPRRRLARAARRPSRRAGRDPVAIGPSTAAGAGDLYRVLELPWDPAWDAGAYRTAAADGASRPHRDEPSAQASQGPDQRSRPLAQRAGSRSLHPGRVAFRRSRSIRPHDRCDH